MIGLVAMVKNEHESIPRLAESVIPLIDSWTVMDTGSEDSTREIVESEFSCLPGQLIERPWRNCGANLTELMAEAQDSADWLLWLHSDMTVSFHPDLRKWLATDPDPDTDAWQVEVSDSSVSYRVPIMVRGGLDWEWVGLTHEYLDGKGRKQRPLLGLSVYHHADGANRATKHERDIELLAEGVESGDTRAVFYTAQALAGLGRTDEAIEMYARRASMGGWEEEAWYADYRAAALAKNIDGLLAAWKARPWRHEPLSTAANIIRAVAHDDVLFNEK